MALSPKLTWELANPLWASQLNPLLANPLSSMSIIKNVSLVVGVNTINHFLGQNQQGWILTDITGPATIYRSQPFNNKTLTLTASAACTVSIGVF